jgi:hypothetical protein
MIHEQQGLSNSSYFAPAVLDRNSHEDYWKTTKKLLTSIKSFKNIEVFKERKG